MLTVFAFQRLGARVSAEGQASSEGEDGTRLGSELGGLRTGSQADPSPTPLIPSGRPHSPWARPPPAGLQEGAWRPVEDQSRQEEGPPSGTL